MIKRFIFKLGANDVRSWRWFLAGFLLLMLAGGFIALGYYFEYWYQIIGLVIAVPALCIMAYGYLGILANRIAQIWQRLADTKRQR